MKKNAKFHNLDNQEGYIDNITGLYNIYFLKEQVLNNFIKKDIYPVTIVKIDINGLRKINNKYSYETGNKVLKIIAELIQENITQIDISIRLRDSEFIIIFLQRRKEEVDDLINFFKNKDINIDIIDSRISLSVGTSEIVDPEREISNGIAEADEIMQQSKITNFNSSRSKVIESMLIMLSSNSQETKEHAERMRFRAKQLGTAINLSASELNQLDQLALLHDIGKVIVPKKILNKPGRLTDEEWKSIIKHPGTGYKIAMQFEEFKSIAKFILHHHEHWNGEGYPGKLKEEEIPLLSRIITIVDSYDVMLHKRSYKSAFSQQEVIKELKACAGTQFDPDLVEEFVRILDNEKEQMRKNKVDLINQLFDGDDIYSFQKSIDELIEFYINGLKP
ncbi:MAG: HD-GYP domain-containing protein [bacterium]